MPWCGRAMSSQAFAGIVIVLERRTEVRPPDHRIVEWRSWSGERVRFMSKPITVNDGDFATSVLGADAPVIVDFWAPWCGPCRAIAPMVDDLATEYDGRVTFAKLNADDNPRTMSSYGVMGIPTLIAFKGGKEVGRLVGLRPKPALKQMVEGTLVG